MIDPPRYTEDQLQIDIDKALDIFRKQRLNVDPADWAAEIAKQTVKARRLFDLHNVAAIDRLTPEDIQGIYSDKQDDILRYLIGPPISEDDLPVVAGYPPKPKLSSKRIISDRDAAAAILKVLLASVDLQRFPWLDPARGPDHTPTGEERERAIRISAALHARERMQTIKRNEAKAQQESALKAYLLSINFKHVPAKDSGIQTYGDAPPPGAFTDETKIGKRKADVPIRLFDGRMIATECKVSNSVINSIKRVNNDAAAKATAWQKAFGENQIIPAALLTGVFDFEKLLDAQSSGLTLFWAHDFDALGRFLLAAR